MRCSLRSAVMVAALGATVPMGAGAANSDFAPNWRVGDSWSVRLTYHTPVTKWSTVIGYQAREDVFTYTVTSAATSGLPSAVVQVRRWGRDLNPYDDQIWREDGWGQTNAKLTWELTFETNGMSLISVEEPSRSRSERTIHRNPFSAETWPVGKEGYDFCEFPILGFPRIPDTSADEERDLEEDGGSERRPGTLLLDDEYVPLPGHVVYRATKLEEPVHQSVTFRSNLCTVTVQQRRERYVREKKDHRMSFVWESGKKWWSWATVQNGTNPPAVAVLFDSDGDYLSDDWEMKFFHSLSHGGDDDPDGDGASNLEEFIAETDPTDARSRPEDVTTTNPLAATFQPGPQGAGNAVPGVGVLQGKLCKWKEAWEYRDRGRGSWNRYYTTTAAGANSTVSVVVQYDCRLKDIPPPASDCRVFRLRDVNVPGARKSRCIRAAYWCASSCGSGDCSGWCGANWSLEALKGAALIKVAIFQTSLDGQPLWHPPAIEPAEVAERKIAMLVDLAEAFLALRGPIQHRYEAMEVAISASVNHGPSRPLVPTGDLKSGYDYGMPFHKDYVLEAGMGDWLSLDFAILADGVSMAVDHQRVYPHQPCSGEGIEAREGRSPAVAFRWTTDERGMAHLDWGTLSRVTAKCFQIQHGGRYDNPDCFAQATIFLRPPGVPLHKARHTCSTPTSERDSVWKAVLERIEESHNPDYDEILGGRSFAPGDRALLRRANMSFGDNLLTNAASFLRAETWATTAPTFDEMAILKAPSDLIPLLRVKPWLDPRVEIRGDARGEWYEDEAQRVLLLWRMGEMVHDTNLLHEAKQRTEALCAAMAFATNATLVAAESVSRWTRSSPCRMVNGAAWPANAWAAILMCEAFDSTQEPRLAEVAALQARMLMTRRRGQESAGITPLAYHALRRAAESLGDAAFAEAAKAMRDALLKEWPTGSYDPGWLMRLLRTFDKSFYPYEEERRTPAPPNEAGTRATPGS